MQPNFAVSEVNEDDDAALLARLKAGEKEAFEVLVRRHAVRFYRVAYRFVRSRAESEDIVQEAFLKLWERPHMWQAEKNVAFTTWFHRVIINLCLDRQKKKRPLPLIDDRFVPDERESQEDSLMQRQLQAQLETHIAALPERQRVALNLCFSEGMSNQEAADIMGVKLKALQSLLMRAKMTLKDKLNESRVGV